MGGGGPGGSGGRVGGGGRGVGRVRGGGVGVRGESGSGGEGLGGEGGGSGEEWGAGWAYTHLSFVTLLCCCVYCCLSTSVHAIHPHRDGAPGGGGAEGIGYLVLLAEACLSHKKGVFHTWSGTKKGKKTSYCTYVHAPDHSE